MKLISGKMNVPYIKCKPGYAEGVKKPIKPKDRPVTVPFNPPTLVIKLRRVKNEKQN